MTDAGTRRAELASIGSVTEQEVPAMAASLAAAFYDDPVNSWLLPNDETRLDQLERSFELFIRQIYLTHDEMYATRQVVGAAIWEPPGAWKVPILKQLRLTPATIAVYGRRTPALLRMVSRMESGHPQEPHMYLPFVGVRPEWQGTGIGSALLRPVLDRCDRDRLPAYLEASSPRSRACYERLGFELMEEFEPAPGCPPLWRMWREPA
jgi:GNAT superfamily N-acetyltransferase